MGLLCTNYPGSDLATIDSDSSFPSSPSLLTSDGDNLNEDISTSQFDPDRAEKPPPVTLATSGLGAGTVEDDERQEDASENVTTVGTGSAKGKEKMTSTDEVIARSIFAEDALHEFDAYRRNSGRPRPIYAPAEETDSLMLREFLNERTSLHSPQLIEQLALALRPLQDEVFDFRDFLGRRRARQNIPIVGEPEEPHLPSMPPGVILPPLPPPIRLFRREERIQDEQFICAACRCAITGTVIRLDCGSKYDVECIKRMFEANVDDEFRFPPRCCGQVVPLNIVKDQLSQETRDLYESKIEEYSTPSRLYCSNAACARFLGARQRRAVAISCGACETETCALCTTPAHDASQKCKIDKGMRKALKLGQSNGWQRCPRCRQLVERNDGCYHMSCRCGAQFCYLCAGNWGSCKCWQKRRALLKIILFRWLHLRGDYLVNEEPAANGENCVARVCRRSWESVKKVVTPQSQAKTQANGSGAGAGAEAGPLPEMVEVRSG